ncbi:RecF/RecN/SMC family protein [Flavobacterium croceum DSM 17960]|uniref:RecF/RecN/SMC family protein n=1 Tax=Flavobacterium croceum DSM 17960 TaxID=1121886 RepID=A0A2S4N8U8_9FLAO|nr:AAA family ATPase [Flavobacterium croceum]POS02125.1 RecF/RecN/SMC family protein [Flavobacterium croceum DSM 17960]
MATKINEINLKGIRGAKDTLKLPLNGKSVLLYGDNGTGKSSISDSLEWFFTDKVEHLSSLEIDLKEALRNAKIDASETSEVKLSFTNNKVDATKSIYYKKAKLVSEFNNTSEDFTKFFTDTKNENLILRFKNLTNFVDNTKTEKLKYLSEIIGFSEVSKKKEVLQKCYNAVKSEITKQNFEGQKSNLQRVLIDKIGASISQEQNFIDKLNEKIKPLNVGFEIKTLEDIDKVLTHLTSPENNKLNLELAFLESIQNSFTLLKSEIGFINSEYGKYYLEFEKIALDVQSIMQTFFKELLNTGKNVITKYHKEDSCPLCLQPKNIEELQSEISKRLEEIEESSKKLNDFNKSKTLVSEIALERAKRIDTLLLNPDINNKENEVLKIDIQKIKDKIGAFQIASTIKVTSGEKISEPEKINLVESDFDFQAKISERIIKLKEALKNNSTILYNEISSSKEAFLNIRLIEKQKSILENQQNSLKIIYDEFIKKQKEGLENFITTFSGKINEFYQFMNPNEPFQEIKIVTIGEDDELNGLTIEYKYEGNWVSPPQKYFSESHLNCFGLSFFLASVIAFNKESQFVVLDDVISSFDSTHRKKFADLIIEKFNDYQFIVLTHEREWFDNMIKPLAKKKGWYINEIKWSESKGTHFNETPNELKDFIEHNLSNGISNGMGNPIRRYMEQKLKDIASNTDTKVIFRFNEINEHRMCYELITSLKSTIKITNKDLLVTYPVIDRIENSAQIGNTLSHDNPLDSKIGDLKAIWSDILEFEKIFYCQEANCKKPKVSLKNYDPVLKTIRCGCGKTSYNWKV